MAEIAAVAAALGYDFPEAIARALAWLRELAPPGMKASMARDFERGGRTELETRTGALVRLAAAKTGRDSGHAHGVRYLEAAPANGSGRQSPATAC